MSSAHSLFGRIILVLAVLAVFVSVAFSAEDFQVPRELRNEYRIGNLNQPQGSVPGIFNGNEAYAYYVYPPSQCECEEEGFKLLSVTQGLHFDEQQIPALLNVRALLIKAELDSSQDYYIPGDVLFEGPLQTFLIEDNGPVLVTVPTGGSEAFPFDDHYFIGLRYEGNAPGSLLIDDEPLPGIEYINTGNGWFDLYGWQKRAGGGKVIVYGDIVCSPLGVPTETRAWDGIKSLYR